MSSSYCDWEPDLRDIPDEPYTDRCERCPDCGSPLIAVGCGTCGLTDDEIAQRLTGAR